MTAEPAPTRTWSLRSTVFLLSLTAAGMLVWWALENPEAPAPGEVRSHDGEAGNSSGRVGVLSEATGSSAEPGRAGAGDFSLGDGDGVRFFVSNPKHRSGFEKSGGNLIGIEIDGELLGFGSMTTMFDRVFPQQAIYETVTIEGALLRSSGRDSGNSAIRVVTDWSLKGHPDPSVRAQLEVRTTLHNTGTSRILDYELGDNVSWGSLQHFAPGPGSALTGRDEALDWVGAENERGALILLSSRRLTGPHGAAWSDPVWDTVHIEPGEKVEYRRSLLLGRKLGELSGPALDHLRRSASSLDVQVLEESSERPLADIRVLVTRRGATGDFEPVVPGRTRANGRTSFRLEPGSYRVSADSRSRRSLGEVDVLLGHQPLAPVQLRLSGSGLLRLSVTDGDGRDIAARVAFEGIDGTEDPIFGPEAHALGGSRVHLLAPIDLDIPPGHYRLTASHGPAWSLDSVEVLVPQTGSPGAAVPSAQMQLFQRVEVPGWRQCDFHQHSVYSSDSTIPPVDGLIASAAEDLDCIATTDHDAVADWKGHLESAGLTEEILWLPGIEVSSDEVGHYNVFPWAPELGIIEHQGQTSKAVTDAIRARAPEAILQLNHPLWGNIGLWRILGIDPATGRVRSTNDSGAPTGGSEDYDCVEVLNGKDTDNAEDVLAAWLAMLDQGLFPTAVGNSDSHRIVGQERGASRTWVEVGLDESDGPVAAVVKALKTGRATASTGPFLRLLREPGAGQLTVEMLAPDWLPVDQIELYGGDPEGIGGRSLGSWKPSSSALTEELSGGVRRWLLQVPAEASQGQDWVVAVARGTEPMLPWSEAKALAVTNPLRLPQAEAAGRK